MATTIEELQERLASIQQEIGKVSQALNHLLVTPEHQPDPLALAVTASGQRFVDKEALRSAFPSLLAEAEARDLRPIGPEALQALMISEGIRPEDCSASREIIAMREE